MRIVAIAGAVLTLAACTQRAPEPSLGAGAPAVPAAITIGQFNQCGTCVASHGFVPGDPAAAMTHAKPDEQEAYCRSVGRRVARASESAAVAPGRAVAEGAFACAAPAAATVDGG